MCLVFFFTYRQSDRRERNYEGVSVRVGRSVQILNAHTAHTVHRLRSPVSEHGSARLGCSFLGQKPNPNAQTQPLLINWGFLCDFFCAFCAGFDQFVRSSVLQEDAGGSLGRKFAFGAFRGNRAGSLPVALNPAGCFEAVVVLLLPMW